MTPTPSSILIENAQLFIQLHELIRAQNGESHEAEKIREQLDASWSRLNSEEKTIIKGLSTDLHTLEQSELSSEFDEKLTEGIGQSVMEEKWDEAINLLRKNNLAIHPAVRSYYRGLFWARYGLFDVAVLFFEDAMRWDRVYEVFLIQALIQANRVAEIGVRAQEIAIQSDNWMLVLNAAEALFVWGDEVASEPIHRIAIDAAKRGLDMGKESSDDRWKFLRVNANLNLAISLWRLGESADARKACEEALRLDPINYNAFMVIGMIGCAAGKIPTSKDVRNQLRQRNPIVMADSPFHASIT